MDFDGDSDDAKQEAIQSISNSMKYDLGSHPRGSPTLDQSPWSGIMRLLKMFQIKKQIEDQRQTDGSTNGAPVQQENTYNMPGSKNF